MFLFHAISEEKLCRQVTWTRESGRQRSFYREKKKKKRLTPLVLQWRGILRYLEPKPFVGSGAILSWSDQFMATAEGKEDGASAALLGNHSRRYEPLLTQQAVPARIRSCQQDSITLTVL